jgi:hypothetical protein
MELKTKYTIADKIANSLINQPAYADFTSKDKAVQYGILFSQKLNGQTLEELYGEDDGPHICGLVRHRLNNPAPTNIEIDL